jgi:hypothetical protein
MIPVSSDKHQHSGPLGIMNNVMARMTEIAALFPVRQGRERQYTFQPPTYAIGREIHYMLWCPACAQWQRREAYSDDATRTTGKRGWCKSCAADHQRQYRQRLKTQRAA